VKESDLNTLIAHSFNELGGWAYKIPDPQGMAAISSSKRPFDVIADDSQVSWKIESKFSSKGYKAFNVSRLEDHQYEGLKKLHELGNINIRPIVAYGVWEPRKFFDVFFFSFRCFFVEKEPLAIRSVKAKKLIELKEKGYCLSKYKGLLRVDNLQSIIIDPETINGGENGSSGS